MRHKIIPLLLLAVLYCMALLPSERGFGQTGNGKKPEIKIDPGVVFDQLMSKGRGYFLISEVRSNRADLEKFAAQEGIKDGKLTRNQFVKFWNLRSEQRKQVDSKIAKKSKKPDDDDDDPPLNPAERVFNDLDLNRDGFLNAEEIAFAKQFKNEWKKWDADDDGLISLDEWKAYWRQKDMAPGVLAKKNPSEQETASAKKPPANKIDAKVVQAQVSKTPAVLPAWFAQIDLDKDGQISLYEWKKAGKDIEEFLKLDLNDDGFLTAKEVLRSQQVYILPREMRQQTNQVGTDSSKQKKKEK